MLLNYRRMLKSLRVCDSFPCWSIVLVHSSFESLNPTCLFDIILIHCFFLVCCWSFCTGDLRMPSNARLHLEQHLTRVFNMSHSEYWQQYRTSDACRQQQASLRTASMETEGSGRSKHGMSTYVSQCHIFRADRRSSAKSTRAAL
jgi:hypothetical protein